MSIEPKQFFEAVDEIASIVQRNALREKPLKYLKVIEDLTGEPHAAETAKEEKRIERSIWFLTNTDPQSDEYRLSKNVLCINYAQLMTNAIDLFLQPPGDLKKSIPDSEALIVHFIKGINAAYKHMQFSQKYKDLECAVRDRLLESFEKSGSLKALFQWESMGPEQRKETIIKIANQDFIAAVHAAEPVLAEEILPSAITFKELPDNLKGTYGLGGMTISLGVLEEDTPDEALKTAIHESGHHLDLIIESMPPPGYEKDGELLRALRGLKVHSSKFMFDKVIYHVTPAEKRPFENTVCDPIIAIVNGYKDQGRLSRRLEAFAYKSAPAVTNILRCFAG